VYIDPIGVILGVGAGLLFLGIYLYVLKRIQAGRRVQLLHRVNLDRLDGTEFESLVAQLLSQRGYRVQHTGRSGDLGVDLIADKPPLRYAVQVKRQAQPVSRRAVSDAVAGMAHYHCNAAMVVTNHLFSPGAHQLARSNHCKLVDRNLLADWMMEAHR
jgi:HJR/Mrr/RecB family endonuclease